MSILHVPSVQRTIRNQHYLVANTANGNNQYLYTSFANISNNCRFAGDLWFKLPGDISTTVPVLLASLGESNAVGADHSAIALIGTAPGQIRIILSYGDLLSSGSVSETFSIQTAPITISTSTWQHVKFLFRSDSSVMSDQFISLNGASYVPTVKTGSPVLPVVNYASGKVFQYGIPSGLRMASIWLTTGITTSTEFLNGVFGEKAPLWRNQVGSSATGRPAVVYLHGSKMVIENSVNGSTFLNSGANFVSVVHPSARTDFVLR